MTQSEDAILRLINTQEATLIKKVVVVNNLNLLFKGFQHAVE